MLCVDVVLNGYAAEEFLSYSMSTTKDEDIFFSNDIKEAHNCSLVIQVSFSINIFTLTV